MKPTFILVHDVAGYTRHIPKHWETDLAVSEFGETFIHARPPFGPSISCEVTESVEEIYAMLEPKTYEQGVEDGQQYEQGFNDGRGAGYREHQFEIVQIPAYWEETEEESRARFDRWIRKEYPDFPEALDRENGEWSSEITNHEYAGWQAALSFKG